MILSLPCAILSSKTPADPLTTPFPSILLQPNFLAIESITLGVIGSTRIEKSRRCAVECGLVMSQLDVICR